MIDERRKQLAIIKKTQQAALDDLKSKQLESEGTRKILLAEEVGIKDLVAATQKDIDKLETQTGSLKDEILQLDLEIITQEGLADAELKGLNEGSKPGKGPRYRRIIEQANKLKTKKINIESQLSFFNERLTGLKNTLQVQNIQLSDLQSQLFSLNNPEQSGSQPLPGRANSLSAENETFNQSVANLNAAILAFEQKPSRVSAENLQAQCSISRELAGSYINGSDNSLSCETSRLNLAAAPLYSLNQGMQNLQNSCVGGDAGALPSTPEKQLDQISNCLKASNLSYTESEDIRDKIASLDRNRDDKAHRFVVTLNSFSDGNKLALLTLAIAIAIDSLVFASGVFGANVLRSPLATIPDNTGRTAETINQILANSLEPNIGANASLALETIQPMETYHETLIAEGWSHKISLANEHNHSARQLQKLINAAVILGAAKPDPTIKDNYRIRSELIEFLSEVSASASLGGKQDNEYSRSVRKVIETLGPEHEKNASILLQYMQPTSDEHDFSSQITMSQVEINDKPMVIQFLNSASANKVVKCKNVNGKVESAIISSKLCNSLISLADETPSDRVSADNQISVVEDAATVDEMPTSNSVLAKKNYDQLEDTTPITKQTLSRPIAETESTPAKPQVLRQPDPVVTLASSTKASNPANIEAGVSTQSGNLLKKREFAQNVSVNPPISVKPKIKASGPQIVRTRTNLQSQQKARKAAQHNVEKEPVAEQAKNEQRDRPRNVRIVGDGFKFD